MEVYLVGGAVRDKIMGREPHDKDYVVTGSTIQEMIDNGYKQVGNDFPVFLHPKTGDEYALARTEKKVGDKHTDFGQEVKKTKEELSSLGIQINQYDLIKLLETYNLVKRS